MASAAFISARKSRLSELMAAHVHWRDAVINPAIAALNAALPSDPGLRLLADILTAAVLKINLYRPELERLIAETNAMVPDDPPDPDPDPDPEPDPDPITVHKLALRTDAMVMLSDQSKSGYTRYQKHLCLTADTFALPFARYAMLSLVKRPLAYPKYGLWFGDENSRGVELATYTRIAAEDGGKFNGSTTSLQDRPYRTSIVAYDDSGVEVANPVETLMQFWLWVDRNGTARNYPDVVFQNDEYDWTHTNQPPAYLWALLPKTELEQFVEPSTWRDMPPSNAPFPGGFPFNTVEPGSRIRRVNYAVTTDNADVIHHRPAVTTRGITVTDNKTGYFANEFHGSPPRQPLLDGPRGLATCFSPTAIWVGHAGAIYVGENGSFSRFGVDGTKKTLAGMRHATAPYWEEIHQLPYEIVGDWDASVSIDRRFPWEPWALFPDSRTIKQDPSLPLVPVPTFPPLQQHLGFGPRFFMTCRFGRVLCFQFDKSNPGAVPHCSEFIKDMGDPWGGGQTDDTILICERTKHRISEWSKDDGRYLGSVLENPAGDNFGEMDNEHWRRWQGSGTLPQRRAQSIIAPEGFALMDGYYYFASGAQQDIRRYHRATQTLEICARIDKYWSSEQSRFVAIAVSDGTFYPRHTIFATTFAIENNGRARMFLPAPGVDADGPITHSRTASYQSDGDRIIQGVGGKTAGSNYPLGVGVGNGMLVQGAAQYGLDAYVLAPPGAVAPDYERIKRGYGVYRNKGHRLLHGNYGWGYVKGGLPWGEDVDQDYYLEHGCGHDPNYVL